jgi:hypothetical protein
MACFTAQDCAPNETCAFNRCQAAPEVYADMGMATASDSGLEFESDAFVGEADSGLVDMTITEVDQSLRDMVVSQDMSVMDVSLQVDADSVPDTAVNLDLPDASAQDAAAQDAAAQDAAAQDAAAQDAEL